MFSETHSSTKAIARSLIDNSLGVSLRNYIARGREECNTMKGRKPNITALPGALDKAPPAPAWLPKFANTEWAPVVPVLVKARSRTVHHRIILPVHRSHSRV